MSFITILWYILIALLPGIFWAWFYRRKDKRDPEPLKLIIETFLWGMFVTLPAIALEFAADYFFNFSQSKNIFVIILSGFLIIAPIEEYLKYKVVREKIYQHPAFNEPLDGIIYCIVAALGFASLENILVVFTEGQNAVFLRFATATLMHALASGIVGYYLGKVKFGKEKDSSLIYQGLIIAIIFHGLYNLIVTFSQSWALVLVSILLVFMYFVLSKKIKELKREYKACE